METNPPDADQQEPPPPAVAKINLPLKDSPNERARETAGLHEQLIVDPEEMNPAAARYFRRRPWLTPEVARAWRMGYLPNSARGMLRGRIVYGYFNERDHALSYFGRDPAFEQKRQAWERGGRPETGKPVKHRFVRGFLRGLELFGQNGRVRLQDERLKESLTTIGLVVVEGPNDVIRLDCLGVAAVGLCSNRATDEQIAKIVRFARNLSGGKVVLAPDTDTEGEEGFRELLWQLHHFEGILPRLAWSSTLEEGRFADRQPESLSAEEWQELSERLTYK